MQEKKKCKKCKVFISNDDAQYYRGFCPSCWNERENEHSQEQYEDTGNAEWLK